MKIISKVSQGYVFNHWEKVEKISIYNRSDIILPIIAYNNLIWNLCEIEEKDISKIFICSTDDWKTDGLCIPDFKLITAIDNYHKRFFNEGKYANIKQKESIFSKNIHALDTKLILVSSSNTGPYTIIEGCKRSVALGSLNKLTKLQVFVGISKFIKNYVWARYM